MKTIALLMLLASALTQAESYRYEPSAQNPFGQPHPDAPKQIKQFAPMIGIADCSSEARLDPNTWATPIDMTWRFKYIMNGMAVQDETLKADGQHSGSIRQFDSETKQWIVHYYNSSQIAKTLPAWQGGLQDDRIVLLREQKAPNGMDGSYRLTFFNMQENGYQWIGEWINPDASIVYPTWKINCKKRTS